MADIEDYLEAGDGVIDVGANRGDYAARYARKVGESGHVVAVEPDPETVKLGRAQHGNYAQLTWLERAVTDRDDDRVPLYRDSESPRNSLWEANTIRQDNGYITVDTITLDTIAASVPNLAGIKIDAQGAEMQILRGASHCLANRELVWYMELWPHGLTSAGSSAEAVIAFLEERGFQPIGQAWQHFRGAIPNHGGHSSMDVLFRHKDS